MVKLSDRLNAVAKEFKRGETMADIGTDHGYLPVYLWENSLSPYVIMTDINEGPLSVARENCRLLPHKFKFDFRLGDGLDPIKPDEVYTIVIAGMGGILISRILSKDMEKSKSFVKLILQPRSKRGYLRHFLMNNGFYIKKEKLVREGRYICSVIVVDNEKEFELPENLADADADSIKWEIPINIDKKDFLYEEYLVGIYNSEVDVYHNIKKGGNAADRELAHHLDRIYYMKHILDTERYFYEDLTEERMRYEDKRGN